MSSPDDFCGFLTNLWYNKEKTTIGRNGRIDEMSVIKELIRTENNGSISFGNYELAEKAKLDNY